MDTTNAPQIIDHHSSSLDFTPYDTKWVPGSAQFVLGGQTMKATGIPKMTTAKRRLRIIPAKVVRATAMPPYQMIWTNIGIRPPRASW